MAQAKGSLSQICIDFETAYGTDPGAPAAQKVPFNSSDLKSDRNMIEPATITGIRDPVAPAFGNTNVGGNLVIPVDENNFGYWLKALCGVPATTGSGDPYTHTFKPTSAAAGLPSMVIEAGFTDITQYFKFNGCKVNSLSMSVGGDGELTASLDIMGAKETASGTVYDAAPTSDAFARLNQFQAALEEGGSSIAICRSFNFEINNNLDGSSFVIGGGGIRTAIPEGMVGVSGEIEIQFADLTEYTKAINLTESSLKCTFTSGTHSLEFFFPELNYRQGGPPIPNPAGIYLTLPFYAFYDDNADTTVAKITLINATASYA